MAAVSPARPGRVEDITSTLDSSFSSMQSSPRARAMVSALLSPSRAAAGKALEALRSDCVQSANEIEAFLNSNEKLIQRRSWLPRPVRVSVVPYSS